MGPVETPSLAALQTVAVRLRRGGIPFALGGSGLLASLGLAAEVRDWDVTTPSPMEVVLPLLEDFEHEVVGPNGLFATRYMLRVRVEGAAFDIMGDFALRHEHGVFVVPTVVSAYWHGVPVGSAEAWAVAYALLGRPEKAERLFAHLEANGANRGLVQSLLAAGRLPQALHRRLAQLVAPT